MRHRRVTSNSNFLHMDYGITALILALHLAGFWALVAYAPARETIANTTPLMFSLVRPESVRGEPPRTRLPQPRPVKPQLKSIPAQPAASLAATTYAPVTDTAPLPELLNPRVNDAPAMPLPAVEAAASIELPVTPPETSADYASNHLPQYPAASRRLGEEGKLEVRVCVSANGTVSSATVTKSSGFGRLDRATTEALLQWRFSPAKRGTEPVPGCVTVPWSWSLSDARF